VGERADIEAFLGSKRIALVGASRRRRSFSRALMRDLLRAGFEVVPVNPEAKEIEGRPCVPRIGAVDPPAEAALIMTPRSASLAIARECADAGVSRVWFQPGSETAEAIALSRERGLAVIEGRCPWMFVPGAGLIHRVHRGLLKITGQLPQ
jgi:predicted CoA-binding protein